MKLELMINQKYAQLNETDKEIVTFIVQHKSFVRASSLEQVAGESLFSKSSIFRACKKIGLTGYSQLQYLLQAESADEDVTTTSSDYLSQTVKSLLWTVNQFKGTKVDDVYADIANAGSIYIYATGWIQQIAAEQLQRDLFLLGIDTFVFPPAAEEVAQPRHNVKVGDLVIIISYSGMNTRVLHFMDSLKMQGIKIVSFTSFRQNQIAQASDHNLYFDVVSKKIGTQDRQENFFANLHILMDIFTMGLSNYLTNHAPKES